MSDIDRPDCPRCDDGGHLVACGTSVKWWECSRCGYQETREDPPEFDVRTDR